VQLRFELGDAQAPRGHAILFARAGGDVRHILATYCIVLPIQFSIGKYLPPMFASQLPLEGLRDASAMSVVPIPPMLEDVPSLATLRQLAERRADDLCDMGTIYLSDDSHRMSLAAEASAQYSQLYAEYMQRWPSPDVVAPAEPVAELDVNEVLAEVLPERDRLGELARLVGQARYAIDGHDQRLLDEVTRAMQRIARSLPEKYRADQLVEAALRHDTIGPRLAELYLQRAYKLLDEDYSDIPPIERDIRALRDGEGEQPPSIT
jgi:hypothetical protein